MKHAGRMNRVGELVRSWRKRRGRTQLQLAEAAGLSARHLSFLENGRARPSREMLGVLCDALDVPLRDRNTWLLAAGYAPQYSEHALDSEAMREAHTALALILKAHEPLPAVCFDRLGELRIANAACFALAQALNVSVPTARPYMLVPAPRPNLVSLILSHAGLRAQIKNWSEVAQGVVERARRELIRADDTLTRAVLEAAVAQSGLTQPDGGSVRPRLWLPVEIELAGTRLRFLSTITTFATAFDITLAELRIEVLHPADAASDAFVRERLPIASTH